jgi:glycosyltransferase involved in cell wall biosynthesis
MAYTLADRVLANSPSVARSLTSNDGVAPHRIAVVPNFVDDSAFDAPRNQRHPLLAELGIPQDARVIGVVARLDPIKEHETLLHAAALLARRWPMLHVVIVGDGENRGALERLSATLGLRDRVHFAGYRSNVPNVNHAFEVAVLSSRSEGFPNTIVEAMAAGRAVVASDVGGNSDAVVHGVTGLLAAAGDRAGFANALDIVLGDPALARRMGEAGRRRAHAEFNATAALARLATLYDSLITDGP